MVTIFTIPKPFSGLTAIHQTNAICSWLRLHPDVEVILFGNDAGVAEFCSTHGCLHLGEIAVNEFGTPYLNVAYREARRHATHQMVCYLNADIMLTSSFAEAMKALRGRDVLGVVRRLNIDLSEMLDFSDPAWETNLLEYARSHGTMGWKGEIDGFVFKKDGFLPELPPFVVGRPGWDPWMIRTARQRHVPVVDFTPTALLIHQNHGYAHVKQATGKQWQGPEADRNYKLELGTIGNFYTIDDATHILENGKIRLALDYHHVRVRFGRILEKAPGIRSAFLFLKKLTGIREKEPDPKVKL